jgi:hypothetical protein
MLSSRLVVFVCFAAISLCVLICAPCSSAQSTTLGTVAPPQAIACGLLSGQNVLDSQYQRNFDLSMQSCFTSTLQNCPGVSDLGFVFGYAPPTGGGVKGTVVMLSGDGGTNAAIGTNFSYYVPYYESQGYQVVEVAWGPYGGYGVPWELANPSAQPYPSSNIEAAACRPATFLNWVRNGNSGVGNGIWNQCQGKTSCNNGGMCAHGDSGGAGALGYVLGWWNAGTGGPPTYGGGYLDKVEMENGPVFANIDNGCNITCSNGTCGNYQTQLICSGSMVGGNNPNGCNNWTNTPDQTNGQNYPYPLEYVDNDEYSVNTWSGNTAQNSPGCGNNQLATTYDSSWQAMSIIPSSGPQPSFNYPDTGISAWLCEYPLGAGISFNNATAEGGLFFYNLTQQSQAGGSLWVNGVTSCKNSPEDIEDGIVVINTVTYGPPPTYSQTVIQAIENDMVGNSPSTALSCNALGLIRLQQ